MKDKPTLDQIRESIREYVRLYAKMHRNIGGDDNTPLIALDSYNGKGVPALAHA